MTCSIVLAAAVAALVACGSHQPPGPKPIGNAADAPAPAAVPGTVSGTIYDEHAAPLVGATLILVIDASIANEQPVITDDNGGYRFTGDVAAGAHALRIYYADLTVERTFAVDGPTTVDQHVNTHAAGGEIVHCAADALTSCY